MAHLQVSASAIARELCTPESPPSYSNFRTAAAASTTARQRSQGHRTPSVSTLMCTHTEARTLMCTHVCDWCALGLWRHSVCGASVARTRPAPNDRQHCGRRQDWARALPWGQACQRSLYCIKVRARSSPVPREGRQSNRPSWRVGGESGRVRMSLSGQRRVGHVSGSLRRQVQCVKRGSDLPIEISLTFAG